MQNWVDHVVKKWWEETLQDTAKLARYVKYKHKDALNQRKRSMWRSWQHQVFGKDWFYRLFVAFGTIEPAMLEIVSELALHRAKFPCEALASSQGDALPDRCKNLSQHQKAELLAERIPTVQGANPIRTEAYTARARARCEGAALGSESDNIPWRAEHRKKERSMPRRHVDALWDTAHENSKKSRLPFIEEAVNIFLTRYGTQWKTISK